MHEKITMWNIINLTNAETPHKNELVFFALIAIASGKAHDNQDLSKSLRSQFLAFCDTVILVLYIQYSTSRHDYSSSHLAKLMRIFKVKNYKMVKVLPGVIVQYRWKSLISLVSL